MSEQPGFNQTGPESVIDQPVGSDDLNTELTKNSRSVNRLTLALGGVVLLDGAFFGGVATHAALADQPAAAPTRPGFGQQRAGGGNGNGQGNGGTGNPNGRDAIGVIDHIDGSDIYVKTPDGRTVKVSTSDSTQVRVS